MNELTETDWGDYRFVLALGLPPTKIMKTLLKECPYTETHGGEKGIVFFSDLDTARAYRDSRKLLMRNVAFIPEGDRATLVAESVKHERCNAVFCIRREGKGFIRDVTGIVSDHSPFLPSEN